MDAVAYIKKTWSWFGPAEDSDPGSPRSLYRKQLALFLLLLAGVVLRLRQWVFVRCLWLFSFAGLYFLSLESLSENTVLLSYWSPYFMPWPPWSDPGWFGRTLVLLFRNPGGFMILGLAIPVFLLGCVVLTRRNWRWALCVLGPFFYLLAASAFKKYPFSSRLVLFMLPALLLAFAAGIEWLRAAAFRIRIKHAGVVITLLLAAVCLWDPVRLSVEAIAYPDNKENIRPLVAQLARKAKPGDHLSVYIHGYPAFLYYKRRHTLDGVHIQSGPYGRKEPTRLVKHLDKFKHKGRVWLLFSHIHKPRDKTRLDGFSDEEKYMLSHAEAIGPGLEHTREEGASLHLYRF